MYIWLFLFLATKCTESFDLDTWPLA